ncbi:MAG: EamA family transporter [Desulfovibrio sp.]|nr:EamA family transporter [Desulfovibrio sp.]
MWKYYALLSAFFAALTAICSKLGVKDIDPNLATAVRVAFILFLVWGVVLFQGAISDVRTLDSRSLLFLLLSALTTGLSWLFYFQALACGDVSRVAPLDKLSVPLVILLSFLLLGEPLGWKVIIGGSLITAGSLVLLL